MRTDKNPHILSAHMLNDCFKLSARTIEQRDRLARLHPQNLNMACSCSGQLHGSTRLERLRAIKAWHLDLRLHATPPKGADGRG